MWAQFSRMPMMSGPLPLWIAAAVFGWMSLALTNSMLTVAPVFFMKSSSICFLKNGSASGMKLDHWSTDRVVPLRFGGAEVLAAGAAVAAPAAGAAGAVVAAGAAAGAAGFAASAGLAASVGFGAAGASVGFGACVAPPQAARSIRLAPLPASPRN